jgi:hypothetical protein
MNKICPISSRIKLLSYMNPSFVISAFLLCLFFMAFGCAHPIRVVETWEKSVPIENASKSIDQLPYDLEIICGKPSSSGILPINVDKLIKQPKKIQIWGKQYYSKYGDGDPCVGTCVGIVGKPVLFFIALPFGGYPFWAPWGQAELPDHNGNERYDWYEYLYDLSAWVNPFTAMPLGMDRKLTRDIVLRTKRGITIIREPATECKVNGIFRAEDKQESFTILTDSNGQGSVDMAPFVKAFVGDDVEVELSAEYADDKSVHYTGNITAFDICEITRMRYGADVFRQITSHKLDLISRLYTNKVFNFAKLNMWGDIEVLGPLALQPVIALTKDQDNYTRVQAIKVIAKLTDQRICEPLFEALNDEYFAVRCSAADALGEIGDSRAVEPLIMKLKDKNGYVRAKAATALGKLGDSRAIKPLKAARTDSYIGTRKSVVKALSKIRQ